MSTRSESELYYVMSALTNTGLLGIFLTFAELSTYSFALFSELATLHLSLYIYSNGLVANMVSTLSTGN